MPIEGTEASWNASVTEDLRANAGRVTQGPLAGSSLVLLTTTGARSGKARVSPLGFSRDGEQLVVVGSNSGRDWDPAWVRNVEAHPEVTIEVDGERLEATATIETGTERRRLLDAHIAKIPIFARYESMTERPLPVVTITPKAASNPDPDRSAWEEALIADLRTHGGRPSSGPLAGQPLLILNSIGARSGSSRRAILTYSRDGEDYIVAGTKGGAPTDPAWVGNIRANPNVTVEVGNETFQFTATIVDEPERERLWRRHVEELPWFAPYEEKAGRVIPVIRLTRAPA